MLKLAQGYIEYVSYNKLFRLYGGNQNHNLVLLGNMKQYYSYIRRLLFSIFFLKQVYVIGGVFIIDGFTFQLL